MTSNGIRADFAIVMCRTEEETNSGEINSKMTQIIVPNSPGFNIIRSCQFGVILVEIVEIKYENVSAS